MEVIIIEHLWKEFQFNKVKSLLNPNRYRRWLNKNNLVALKNINLRVKEKEKLGIMGLNGAGKTTLLRIMANILKPTKGKISVLGSSIPMLQLGSGFHPEFTGRENVYFNAALLGMAKSGIEKIFPEIVDFSELADFIDLPLKFYSVGMLLRLGFAVNVHMKPDILFVDEVFTVGDVTFRQKCLDKMNQLNEQGTTIVLVTHDSQLLENFCNRAVLLDQGKLVADSQPSQINYVYLQRINKKLNRNKDTLHFQKNTALIKNIKIDGTDDRVFLTGTDATVSYDVYFHRLVKNPIFGLTISNSGLLPIYSTNTVWLGKKTGIFNNRQKVTALFKFPLLLTPGRYFITCDVVSENQKKIFERQKYKCPFSVSGPFIKGGLIDVPTQFLLK